MRHSVMDDISGKMFAAAETSLSKAELNLTITIFPPFVHSY